MSRPGHRVLLVDDFQDNREMYAEYLTYYGYTVIEASSGYEALQRAAEHGPDIVLMDLALPEIDGWEATRRLKADPRTAGIPIVAVTGHAMSAQQRAALEAGCESCLLKPCLPEDLLAEVRRVLGETTSDEELMEDGGRRQARRTR